MINCKLAIAIVIITLLDGCASRQTWRNYEDATLIPDAATAVITSDLLEALVGTFPPGKTTFGMKPAGVFGQALEKKLRASGYAVALDNDASPQGAIRLAYIVDLFGDQPGTIRIGLRAEPGFRLNRLYRFDAGGIVVPASQMTIRSEY